MSDPPAPREEPRGITRGELELVIRRAVELYTRETDADERLSEDEVLRIADDLGLPGHHVRRALYDLPRGAAEPTFLDRRYGPSLVMGTRVVSGPPERVLTRLEDYLVTREFLQVLRKQTGRVAFSPAEDAISNVARAVRRPQRQWQVARARRVTVEVRPMPERDTHVRLELDVAHHRSRAVTGGIAGGTLVGLPLAAAAFLPTADLLLPIAGDLAATATALAAGASAFGASVAGGIAIARSRFRSRLDRARLEIAGLLDRLEGGGRLDPPPAPWLRSLRSRLAGSIRGLGPGPPDPG